MGVDIMENNDEKLAVVICRQPRSIPKGEILVEEIQGIHWYNISGGVKSRQGAYNLYGYITYEMAVKLVKCSGTHAHYGENAKICVCFSDNKDEHYKGYSYLERLVREKPESIISQNRPNGQPPCTKKILELLSDNPTTRKELRKQLKDIGYRSQTICSALKRLHRGQRIIFDGSSYSPNQIITKSGSNSSDANSIIAY